MRVTTDDCFKCLPQYGVDHSTYSHALADAFGGAPTLSQLYWNYGFKILLAYCFGAGKHCFPASS